MTDTMEIAFVIPEAEVPELRAEVELKGGRVLAEPDAYAVPSSQLDIFGDQQFEPLTILAVSVAIPYLADRLSRLIQRHRSKGGLVIDARGAGLPTLISTEFLDRGDIVVISADGSKVFREEEEGIRQALASVAHAAGGS